MNAKRKADLQKIFDSHQFNVDMEDVIRISLQVDIFELNENKKIVSKHIDVDFPYGEFIEINEHSSLFQVLFSYFDIKDTHEESETILYFAEQ